MKIKGYVCNTDWDTELSIFKANDVKIYSNLKVLKKEKSCWKECGISQIEIKKVKTILKGKL